MCGGGRGDAYVACSGVEQLQACGPQRHKDDRCVGQPFERRLGVWALELQPGSYKSVRTSHGVKRHHIL